jgi:hypothetical protein
MIIDVGQQFTTKTYLSEQNNLSKEATENKQQKLGIVLCADRISRTGIISKQCYNYQKCSCVGSKAV